MFRFVDLQVLSERIAMVLSNSNSKSLRARSAPGMYSSLEGLRCLLNTWPFSKRKGSSITDMIYPNISSHISSHTLWHFSCFFRYPHFNQTTPTTPKTACGIFVRGIEKKKNGMVKTPADADCVSQTGAPVRSYVNRDHLQFFHFIGRVVGKVRGIRPWGEVMNS